MALYFRSGEGLIIIETSARWVLSEAALRGLTTWDHVERRCTMAQMGVTTENAAKTLKPLMPDAHLHYNEHGGSKEKYQTWEAWFSKRLRNRIFYFFHRHGPDGGLVRCFAEWPLEVPPRPSFGLAAE